MSGPSTNERVSQPNPNPNKNGAQAVKNGCILISYGYHYTDEERIFSDKVNENASRVVVSEVIIDYTKYYTDTESEADIHLPVKTKHLRTHAQKFLHINRNSQRMLRLGTSYEIISSCQEYLDLHTDDGRILFL